MVWGFFSGETFSLFFFFFSKPKQTPLFNYRTSAATRGCWRSQSVPELRGVLQAPIGTAHWFRGESENEKGVGDKSRVTWCLLTLNIVFKAAHRWWSYCFPADGYFCLNSALATAPEDVSIIFTDCKGIIKIMPGSTEGKREWNHRR